MKVLIIGLPHFAKRLTEELKQFDKGNQYICLDTYYSFLDKFRFLYHVRNCDIVYSLNGSIYNARAFDMALKLKKKLIIHWVGTDVIKANESHQKGLVNQKYIDEAAHFCEVDWIKLELEEIGVSAEPVPFLSFDDKGYTAEPFPEKFSLLTYIGLNRAEFYGFTEIITLARKFPNIEIKVIGISNYGELLPENVKLLGWVKDMNSTINNAVACVRFPKHDGLSGFVLESLACGRHVIYKYAFPHCSQVNDMTELEDATNSLNQKFSSGELHMNTEGAAYIKAEFSQEKVLSNLIEKFNTALNER